MTSPVKTLANGLNVLEALFTKDFNGKTISELRAETGLDRLAIRRALITLRDRGWVISAPVPGNKEMRWVVAEKLTKISASYRRHAVHQLKALEDEFRNITGDELPR